jgi:antitoxin VapB
MDTLTAKVFKAGNSKAVRLPGTLNVKAKSFVVERQNGGLFLYDPKERAKEMARRRAAIRKLTALGPLEVEMERP